MAVLAPEPLTMASMPELFFRKTQRVMERTGAGDPTNKTNPRVSLEEVEIIERKGDVVTTETGHCYSALSGGYLGAPGVDGQLFKDGVYRSIRAMTEMDRKLAPEKDK